ncbi:MAG TPA: NYN domain-containing protein [Terriglobia bacterium]|nr:NYN domain-containing protein [Terriglobia bacterium]
MAEERLKLAVFIDFDNIQIGVKDTLGKEFDVALVLEALKERGEVVTKVAYGDWHRAGDQSRQMTQHAVQMVQRNVTPRGDKNGADINLALDALEMAFTRHHINGFAIVGGDSDFIALVEKLKQYDKKVFVVGGREFTSNILQRNCTEFVAYEHLLKPPAAGDGGRASRSGRRGEHARAALETRPLSEALPNIQRALQILADRGVAPQLGLLKSTLLQLDSTFSERDYGGGSFLEFMQKMERERLAHLRRTDRGFLVELPAEGEVRPPAAEAETRAEVETTEGAPAPTAATTPEVTGTSADAMNVLRQAVAAAAGKAPNRPLYMRQVRQGMRAIDKTFDERRHGFRGILDLLHQAQREGLIRLQRDHKGVWRIFPLAPSAAAAVAPAEPAPAASEPVIEAQAAASTDFWQSDQTLTAGEAEPVVEVPASIAEEIPAAASADVAEGARSPEPVPLEETGPVIEEAAAASGAAADAPAESAAARKPRKRAARGTSRGRKTTSRRKTKEPGHGEE